MERKTTQRGFGLYEFKDANGQSCSLQKSSSAEIDHIWLGQDEDLLKILVSGEGWKTITQEDVHKRFPEAAHTLLSGRMHLSIQDVKDLLPMLKKFVKTGEI